MPVPPGEQVHDLVGQHQPGLAGTRQDLRPRQALDKKPGEVAPEPCVQGQDRVAAGRDRRMRGHAAIVAQAVVYDPSHHAASRLSTARCFPSPSASSARARRRSGWGLRRRPEGTRHAWSLRRGWSTIVQRTTMPNGRHRCLLFFSGPSLSRVLGRPVPIVTDSERALVLGPARRPAGGRGLAAGLRRSPRLTWPRRCSTGCSTGRTPNIAAELAVRADVCAPHLAEAGPSRHGRNERVTDVVPVAPRPPGVPPVGDGAPPPPPRPGGQNRRTFRVSMTVVPSWNRMPTQSPPDASSHRNRR